MFVKKMVPAAMAIALLAGCASSGKEQAKTEGGVVGGTIASQYGTGNPKLASLGVGTLLGAFIGKDVAAGLDKSDQAQAEVAARRAYGGPIGEKAGWTNPQSGNSGTVTSIRDGYNNAGQYCREYQQTVTVKGTTELAYGTACKQPDGTWKIVAKS